MSDNNRQTPKTFDSFREFKNVKKYEYLRTKIDNLLTVNPFMTRKEVAEELDISEGTVDNVIQGYEYKTSNNNRWYEQLLKIGGGVSIFSYLSNENAFEKVGQFIVDNEEVATLVSLLYVAGKQLMPKVSKFVKKADPETRELLVKLLPAAGSVLTPIVLVATIAIGAVYLISKFRPAEAIKDVIDHYAKLALELRDELNVVVNNTQETIQENVDELVEYWEDFTGQSDFDEGTIYYDDSNNEEPILNIQLLGVENFGDHTNGFVCSRIDFPDYEDWYAAKPITWKYRFKKFYFTAHKQYAFERNDFIRNQCATEPFVPKTPLESPTSDIQEQIRLCEQAGGSWIDGECVMPEPPADDIPPAPEQPDDTEFVDDIPQETEPEPEPEPDYSEAIRLCNNAGGTWDYNTNTCVMPETDTDPEPNTREDIPEDIPEDNTFERF